MQNVKQLMGGVKNSLKPYYHKLQRLCKWYRRIGLKCKDFTIISNNCAGGYVYQYFGIPYCTPTEGIGFCVDDYMKIIKNPRHYFTQELRFICPETTERYKNGEHFTYPVARIDDVTVYFRHYPTRYEAEKKWVRRCSRMNFDRVFFLLTESETMRDEHIIQFSDFIRLSKNKGTLLTVKKVNLPNILTVQNVPIENGVILWHPKIIINTLDWKKILNNL